MLQMVRGLVRVWHQRDVTSIMKYEIAVDIEGCQMRREMSSDSEDSYISELSDSDHEERKVEEEQSSVRIHRTEKDGGCTFYHNTLRT